MTSRAYQACSVVLNNAFNAFKGEYDIFYRSITGIEVVPPTVIFGPYQFSQAVAMLQDLDAASDFSMVRY
jgi:hypothetical protein